MNPRQAFEEFAHIERKFGLDDSPLFKVLHALIEQAERHEAELKALGHLLHGAKKDGAR
jgi:hypothetical protein